MYLWKIRKWKWSWSLYWKIMTSTFRYPVCMCIDTYAYLCIFKAGEGDPPKLESSSGGQSPLLYRLLLLGECSRNPSVSMDQLGLLWEAVFSFSALFLKTQCIYAHDGWFTSASVHTLLSGQQFLTKTAWPPCPTLPTHLVLLLVTFCLFVSLDGKSSQRETFCWCRETKTAEALKGIRINEYKNCSEQRRKRLDRGVASNGQYFEGDWSLNI